MKTKILSFSLTLICSLTLMAQRTTTLRTNNFEAVLCDNGGLFQDYQGVGKLTIKSPGGQRIMTNGLLWIGAYYNNAQYIAMQKGYNPDFDPLGSKTDFHTGPISNDFNDPNYINQFVKLWQISRIDIDYHNAHFKEANYLMHSTIRDWPAHGDTNRGEAFYLAPFHDLDSNGIYEPSLGDYPMIRGDEAVYMIFHDLNRDIAFSDTNSMGLEIHLMVYAFDQAQVYHLNNSLFLNYRIINRSNRSYEQFSTNFYEWLSVGVGWNDLIGSDSSRAMIYAYNRDSTDFGYKGFGNYPGAVAVYDLDYKANGSLYYNNYIPTVDTNTYYPRNKNHYFNLIQGRWRNGEVLRLDNPSGLYDTLNGEGYQSSPPFSPQTNWVYNDQNNWYNSPNKSEITDCLLRYTKPSFPPGDTICWNLAISYANDSADLNPFASVVKLKSKSDALRAFYQAQNYDCQTYKIGLDEKATLPQIQVYPQPAQGYLQIEAPYPLQRVELYRLDGQKCLSLVGNQKKIQVHCAGLASGIYILRMESKEGEPQTKKILIQ